MGKEEWFRGKREKRKRDDQEVVSPGKRRKKEQKHEGEQEKESRIVSVLFVPFTPHGELARRLTEAEKEMEKQTGIRVKIVEKAGTKLIDMLHKADPWQGKDCGRELCLLCSTKMETEKGMEQDCTRRNIVYETWCRSCEEKEKERILEKKMEKEEEKEAIMNIGLHKYIG